MTTLDLTGLRILTVRQPWAWAIIHGGKDVENRRRSMVSPDWRGPIAIHAGLTFDDAALEDNTLHLAWRQKHGVLPRREHPDFIYGAILGLVTLDDHHTETDCVHIEKPSIIHTTLQYCSPWAEGDPYDYDTDMRHLGLSNPVALPEPIPYRGGQSLRHAPQPLINQIASALAKGANS